MVALHRVKVKGGGYTVSEKIQQLVNLLWRSSVKLHQYHKQTGGEYGGGENTKDLQDDIRKVLGKAACDGDGPPENFDLKSVAEKPAISGVYAYSNASIICGHCGFFMDRSVSDTKSRPIVLKAKCTQVGCKNFDKVFRVGDAAKIPLIEE